MKREDLYTPEDEQLMDVIKKLATGRSVSQKDIKAAAQRANGLVDQERVCSDKVIDLAFSLGNYQVLKRGEGLVFEPDEGLVEELGKLRDNAVASLRVELEFVPRITCNYGVRRNYDVELDIGFIENKISVITMVLNQLIAQCLAEV